MSESLVLNVFSPAFNLPDPSPFPIKVMMFMKMHGLDFEAVPGDPRKGPLKKIPYLTHKGKQIADSELIIEYLVDEFRLNDIELNAEQHAQGHMISRALEERTYWAIVYYRWFGEESAPIMRDMLLAEVPSFIRGFIFKMVQKKIGKAIEGHGLGRHTDETISEFMRADYRALSVILGDKDYLFGDKPSRYDCAAVGMTAMAAAEDIPTKAPDVLAEFPNLQSYWGRAKSAYFS